MRYRPLHTTSAPSPERIDAPGEQTLDLRQHAQIEST